MNLYQKISLCMALSMIFGFGDTALAQYSKKEISVSRVPYKAIRAAKKEIYGIRIKEAEIIERDNEETVYELEGKKDNHVYVILVTAKGEILNTDLEKNYEDDRKEHKLSELPQEVRLAAANSKKGMTLKGYEMEYENGQLIYEVEGYVGKQCYEIEVSDDGYVLETERCD